MKCTDNHRIGKLRTVARRKSKWWFTVAVLAAAAISGCGTKTYEFKQAYDVYGTSLHYQVTEDAANDQDVLAADDIPYFAKDLCVGEDVTLGTAEIERSQSAEAAGVFHLASGEITYSQNIYKKLFPASTTKILTAYVALKYGNLDDTITVSQQAANQAPDSSICGVHTGDKLTLETLLYGLLLESGNDAADAIAEHISGDAEKFADLMNQEAAALGATHSHFTNPHGLQDEEHFTCVYDLYLLLQAALSYEDFKTIIHTPKYTAIYEDINGNQVTQEWESTDLFLTGEVTPPKGVSVIGGKTGTTEDAGYCLALFSENAAKEPVISIVMKADSRESLYLLMGDLLAR